MVRPGRVCGAAGAMTGGRHVGPHSSGRLGVGRGLGRGPPLVVEQAHMGAYLAASWACGCVSDTAAAGGVYLYIQHLYCGCPPGLLWQQAGAVGLYAACKVAGQLACAARGLRREGRAGSGGAHGLCWHAGGWPGAKQRHPRAVTSRMAGMRGGVHLELWVVGWRAGGVMGAGAQPGKRQAGRGGTGLVTGPLVPSCAGGCCGCILCRGDTGRRGAGTSCRPAVWPLLGGCAGCAVGLCRFARLSFSAGAAPNHC